MPEADAQTVLGKLVKVCICDGRTVEGQLECIDKDMNAVLTTATEYPRSDHPDAPDRKSTRYLGMVMIPGSSVIQVLLSPMNDEIIS